MAATAGGLGIIFIAVMVTIDVLLRKFLSVTLGGATEIAGWVFAVATAASYPFVLLDRANIRIDALYSRLPTWLRAFLDLAALLVVLYFVGWLTSSVYSLFAKSWSANSTSVGTIIIPLWVPQLFWVLGFSLLTLTALYLTFSTLRALLRGDWAAVNRLAGVPSLVEILEEETHTDMEPALAGVAAHNHGEAR